MKTLKVITSLLAAGLLLAANVSAQSEADQLRLEKTSLFQQNVKVGNIADAVEPWNWVYENYPSSTLYIYAYGTKILNWQIAQAKTEEERAALVVKLMKLYDDRMKYFGQNAKSPTSWILGMKALDYVKYHPNDVLKQDAYNWLEESIAQWGSYSEVAFLQQYFDLSTNMYAKDKTGHGEKYLADFMQVSALLDTVMVSGSEKDATKAEAVKKDVEAKFISSGAADCAAIDAIFGKDLEANKTNQAWLNNALRFFKGLKCVDSDTYFKAAAYSHKISPSVESASACADLAFKNKEYSKAIQYLDEAASLSADKNQKAEILFNIAQIYSVHLDNYIKAKHYCLETLALRPNWGNPYILIATMYAQHGQNVFGDDKILNATIYWAVCDKLEKAKSVDASCADTARQLINRYKVYFPKAEDVFMRPELEVGKSFHIGGWVNEDVICR